MTKQKNHEQDDKLKNIEKDIKSIREHMAILNKEAGITMTNVNWLLKFFWIVATASVSSLVVGLVTLLLK